MSKEAKPPGWSNLSRLTCCKQQQYKSKLALFLFNQLLNKKSFEQCFFSIVVFTNKMNRAKYSLSHILRARNFTTENNFHRKVSLHPATGGTHPDPVIVIRLWRYKALPCRYKTWGFRYKETISRVILLIKITIDKNTLYPESSKEKI